MPFLNENKKSKRINEILGILKSRSLSKAELARLFGVSERTISRDLELLENFGVKKIGKHYEYDKEAINNKLNLDDMAVLNILAGVCQNLGADFSLRANALLERICGVENEPVVVSLQGEILDENELENFAKISSAIKNKNIIKCDYKDYAYSVKPLKIALFEGFWYLCVQDCKSADKFKKFYFKDIKNIEITEQKFEIPAKFEKQIKSANSIWFELENAHTAKLLIMPSVAKYFERKSYIKCDIMRHNSDGSIEIECDFSNIMQIKPLIYRFLPHIKVIEPAWLAEKIKAEIAEYLGEIS